MEVILLQSGSAGNCVFVRSGETRLLFDAGISGCKAKSRLAEYGHDIRDCNALVLSHELTVSDTEIAFLSTAPIATER